MLYIADHTDDFAHFFAFIIGGEARLDAFPNYILAGEKFIGKALVYDDNGCGIHLIVLIEDATLANGDPHGFEVIGRDDPDGSAVLLALRQRMFFHVESYDHVAP